MLETLSDTRTSPQGTTNKNTKDQQKNSKIYKYMADFVGVNKLSYVVLNHKAGCDLICFY